MTVRNATNQFRQATPIGFPDSTATQLLNGTSSSAPSSVFSTTTETTIMVAALENFHFHIGTPTSVATTSSQLLLAGVYDIGVGVNERISVIKATAATAGNVFVTPYRKTS